MVIIQLALIVWRLTGLLHLSWWLVFLPTIAFFLFSFLIILILGVVGSKFDRELKHMME